MLRPWVTPSRFSMLASKLGGGSSYSWGFLWVAPNHLASADDSAADIRAYMEYLSGGQAQARRMAKVLEIAVARYEKQSGTED